MMGGVRNLRENISLLIKSWSLQLRGQDILSQNCTEKLSKALFGESCGLHELTIGFVPLFVGKSISKPMLAVVDEFEAAKSLNLVEYSRFQAHFTSSRYDDFLERRLENLREYLDNYDDLIQVYLYVKQEEKIPQDISPSSKKFRDLKMFYGNLYESITSDLDILACVNNILCGRKYDKFQTMDLNKYRTINKANRAKAFKDRNSFSIVIQHLDSKLRNASHHGAMQLRKNTIRYRSGSGGRARIISYAEYMGLCNQLAFSSCMLLSYGLLLSNDWI